MIDPDRVQHEGYDTVGVLPPPVLDELRTLFRSLELPEEHPFHASSAHGTRTDARRVDLQLKAVLTPLLERVLPTVEPQRPFLAAMISKGARCGASVEFHQDWTYTDERHTDATLVWIPLVDVGHVEGSLRVVPGSHLWSDGIRPSGQGAPGPEQQMELEHASVGLDLLAGEAVVYRPALLHGSSANVTDDPRPAVAIAFAPAGATLVHFHRDGDRLDGFVIDESFFTTEPFGERPSSPLRYPAWTDPVDPTSLSPDPARRRALA